MLASLYGDIPGLGNKVKEEAKKEEQKPPAPKAAPGPVKLDMNHPAFRMLPVKKAAAAAAAAAAPISAEAAKANASNIALELMKLRMAKEERQRSCGGPAAGASAAPASSDMSGASLPSAQKSGVFLAGIKAEYDPMKPNDYDAIIRARNSKKKEEEIERREQEIKRTRERDQRREELEKNSFANRLMKKMGWKDGEGLGKEGQGIAAPLIAQKTDAVTAKIVMGQTLRPLPVNTPATALGPTTVFQRPGNPTRILLLTNVVGKGEVDDELQDEMEEEAKKYGELQKCKIQEVAKLKDEDAVRIFLEFKSIEDSRKAHQKFNGRFFGGRTVKATFFAVDRWIRGDIEPRAGD